MQDYIGRFEAKAAQEHFVLFMNSFQVKMPTTVNLRLYVPPMALPEDGLPTVFNLRLLDNDSSKEVSSGWGIGNWELGIVLWWVGWEEGIRRSF